MQYRWRQGRRDISAEELAGIVILNAHRWYDAAAELNVVEDGVSYPADTESVYREDAFHVASEQSGVDYDVFYYSWLNETPVQLSVAKKVSA